MTKSEKSKRRYLRYCQCGMLYSEHAPETRKCPYSFTAFSAVPSMCTKASSRRYAIYSSTLNRYAVTDRHGRRLRAPSVLYGHGAITGRLSCSQPNMQYLRDPNDQTR